MAANCATSISMDTLATMDVPTPAGTQTDRRSASARHWKLLQYFNFYRVLIAATAVGIALFFGSLPPFGEQDPQLFLYASLTYLVITLFGIEITRSRVPDCETQVGVFGFVDIIFLTLLMYTSGGMVSGLGLLMMLSVTGASFILGRRMTVFIAAVATIAVLVEHSWEWLRGSIISSGDLIEGFPQVGMLGIGLFAISALAHNLSQRLQSSEALAERRGVDLLNLANINEEIIQRMQMGVLVCNVNGHISMINKRTQAFLGMRGNEKTKPPLQQIAPELAETMKQWLENPNGQLRRPFRSKPGYMLLPRFVLLGKDQRSGILVFLNDTALLRQQAQQLKMAALARLTASIAHEIRNPLGAITNAAQLLAESGQQRGDDQRLVEIIEDHSRRMNVIIENITQLSRRDRVSQLRVSLHPWMQEFLQQFMGPNDLPPGSVVFEGAENLTACVDPDQLYQVVVNLCTNALRHCPSYDGGAPLVRIQAGTRGNGQPFIDVIDSGAGIAPEVVDNIFDPFFTTTPQGTGLGLYIARELCEGNGGQLDYIPDQQSGAHFRVTLAKAEDCSEQ